MSATTPTASQQAAPRGSRSRPVNTRRQIVVITLVAIGLYIAIRQLPTGTNLSHLDFRVADGTSIEFCDPANPQFIPVVAVKSPVTMELAAAGGAPAVGQTVSATVKLTTFSGKPIAPPDLLVTHTEKLHLLIFDPALKDYQHVHPTPGKAPGEWDFQFTPHDAGVYRVFADFTPAATARGLYASADLNVRGTAQAQTSVSPSTAQAANGSTLEYSDGDFVFRLKAASLPLHARTISDFEFSVSRKDGAPARLEPVMDAYAHLVAVDENRSGFAHLHPAQLVDAKADAAAYSKLNFKVTIPTSGRYVIWAQTRIDGRDRYAPFWFDVEGKG